ncbi:hypothetical protein F53441_11216 [Fusarium austroafricanum]|uniref:Uncharacterized protein n=1 Tax=Fusarium austroafricanum TaxID=2364996 RepID=A0A8H4K7C9_9HYPO|nr:hypothetical protein F53441_11216 [Fusarium austroafricanum]
MQFSIPTIIAALVTFHTANAGWEISAFNSAGCSLNDADPNDFYRNIKSDQAVPGCFNFGQDMPGTSCTEASPQTTAGPCVDRDLVPKSVSGKGDCVFYMDPGCTGEKLAGVLFPDEYTCINLGADIKSFVCNV